MFRAQVRKLIENRRKKGEKKEEEQISIANSFRNSEFKEFASSAS